MEETEIIRELSNLWLCMCIFFIITWLLIGFFTIAILRNQSFLVKKLNQQDK